MTVVPWPTAGLLDEPVGLAQAEARSLADLLGSEERFERFLDDMSGHAGPGVGHGNHHVLPGRHARVVACIVLIQIRVLGFNRESSTLRHGIPGVDRKIEDSVLKLVGVRVRMPQSTGENRLQPDRLADCVPEQIGHARY